MTAIPSDRLVAPAVTVRSDRLVAPAFTFASWVLAPETFTFPSSAFDFDESKHPRDEHGRFGEGSSEADPAQLERLRAANGVVQRGMNVRLPDEMQAEVARLVKPPMEESELGQHEQIGPMLIEYLAAHDNPNYPEGKGLGTHWTTDGHMAETAARAGARGGWPILITAHVDESQLRKPGSGENWASESEVTLKPDPITVTDVQIPEGIENGVIGRWRSVWPKGETMTAGGFVEEDHPRGPDGKFASKDDDGDTKKAGEAPAGPPYKPVDRDYRIPLNFHAHDGTPYNDTEIRVANIVRDLNQGLDTVDVDLSRMHADFQPMVADRLEKFADEFPWAAQKIGSIVAAEGMNELTMASVGAYTHYPGESPIHISYNSDYFKDPELLRAAVEQDGETLFHPLTTVESVIDHEFGHVIDDVAPRVYGPDGAGRPSDMDVWSQPSKMGDISHYAEQGGPREAFAEAFALRQGAGIDAVKPFAAHEALRETIGRTGGNQNFSLVGSLVVRPPAGTCAGYVSPAARRKVLTAAADWDPEKHPRNEKGEFASSGESDADRATSAMVKALTEPDGGFTIDPRTGDTPNHGYAVAVDGHTSRTPAADFFRGPPGQEAGRQIIRDWLRDQQPYFAAHPEAHVGGWHDPETGHIVLDPSLVVEDRATAVRLGVEGDQQSIADLAAISEGRWDDAFIDTGGTGGVTEEKPLAAAGDFDEGKHPRGPDGRFSSDGEADPRLSIEWGFAGGSEAILEAAAAIVPASADAGYMGYRDASPEHIEAARQMIDAVNHAPATTDDMFSGHHGTYHPMRDWQEGDEVSIPLMSVSPDRALAENYADAHGHGNTERGAGLVPSDAELLKNSSPDLLRQIPAVHEDPQVMLRFEPGARAAHYREDEYIASGRFKVDSIETRERSDGRLFWDPDRGWHAGTVREATLRYVGPVHVDDSMVAAGDFDEEKHPRDAKGRWGTGGTAATKKMLASVPVGARVSQAKIDAWEKANGKAAVNYQKVIYEWSSNEGTRYEKNLEPYLRAAPVIDQQLFRGAVWTGKPLEEGDTFSLHPSSFSRSQKVGAEYSDHTQGEPGILFVLDKGARGLPVDGLSMYQNEREVISGGNFRVTGLGAPRANPFGTEYPVVHVEQV